LRGRLDRQEIEKNAAQAVEIHIPYSPSVGESRAFSGRGGEKRRNGVRCALLNKSRSFKKKRGRSPVEVLCLDGSYASIELRQVGKKGKKKEKKKNGAFQIVAHLSSRAKKGREAGRPPL